MGLHKDQAIILSARAFGESDKILHLYTLNAGKLPGIAKGGRKSQKRFMNTLEPFNLIRIEYFEKFGKGLVRIENADIDESNSGIEKSLKKVCTASFFVEFVDRLTREKEKNEPLFQLLKTILQNIKHVEFSYSDILYYELQMLTHLGFMPNFVSCVQCGKTLPDEEKLYFSRDRGGTLCARCSRAVPHRTCPEGFIPQLSSSGDGPARQGDRTFERLGREILEDFISYHLEVEFRSYRLLKNVTG